RRLTALPLNRQLSVVDKIAAQAAYPSAATDPSNMPKYAIRMVNRCHETVNYRVRPTELSQSATASGSLRLSASSAPLTLSSNEFYLRAISNSGRYHWPATNGQSTGANSWLKFNRLAWQRSMSNQAVIELNCDGDQ
ncbi:MAG: hypothetical protein V2I33_13940, partial [Kangiellaceae bacterium]|nr:hypothetical protein [Kangiellaceae bacterium]